MRTTIRDIARATGVSAMSVSAVLNGSGSNVKVSKDKADEIRRVALDLRYRPNTLARSLRNRRSHMVAVVFQHFDRLADQQPYYPQLLNGVMAALFPAGYTLALCPKLMQGEDAATVSDGRFDGVLWCRPDLSEEVTDSIVNSNIPVVMMHAPPGLVAGVPSFCADNTSALRTAVRHLCQLGHEKIAFVIDPINEHTVEGIARLKAFRAAADAAELEGELIIWRRRPAELAPYARADRPHTAFVCFSDTVAGEVLAACPLAGVSVPDDISVIGFDSSSFCEGTRPRLTSLNQPVERMALAATTHLLDLIRDTSEGVAPSATVSHIYDCVLDIRESTAAPHA